MYVDGDVEDVDLRRVLEGPALDVARRKEVLSDMTLQSICICSSSFYCTPDVLTLTRVVMVRLRKSDKSCGGRDNLRFALCNLTLTRIG